MIYNKKFTWTVFVIVLLPVVTYSQEASTLKATISIREYDKSRDERAIIKILNQNPQFLRYETGGLPEGTTEQYINSPKYTTRVLQENDTTAGFVNFIKIDRKWWFLNFGSIGLVHLMGVDSDYQGKHYGKALLSHAIHSLLEQGVSTIILATKATNGKARNLYEKSGFTLMHQLGDDCLYAASFINEKAPAATLEQKVLSYAVAHPGQATLLVAGLLAGGAYGAYRVVKSHY